MTSKPVMAMSWADRVKSTSLKDKAASNAAADLSIQNPGSTSEVASSNMSSTRSSSSDGSTGQNTAESVTTDQSRPGNDSEVPSTATTASIPDSETVEVKHEDVASSQPVPVGPQPAPAPAVNVWSLRKEKMAQQAVAAQQQAPPAPSHPAPATAAPKKHEGTTSSQKTEPTTRSRAPSKTEAARPVAAPQRDATRPGGAIALNVSATSVPASPSSISPQQSNATPSDVKQWPKPEEEVPQPASTVLKKTRTVSEEHEAKNADGSKESKKKAKWIPIQADITVKPSPTAAPRRQTTSNDRKRETSTESRTSSRPRQPSTNPSLNGHASTFARPDPSRQRDVSSGSSHVSSDDRPRANGMVAHDLYTAARLSPEFHYPHSKPLTPEQPQSSQASSSYNASTRLSPRGLDGTPSFEGTKFEGERYDSESGYKSQYRGTEVGRGGRGGRGRGRGSFENSNGRYPSTRGSYSSGRGSSRTYESSRPHSPNLNGATAASFAPASSVHGYPAQQPAYSSPDLAQGGFQPYPYVPMMPYGYPMLGPDGQFVPADPSQYLQQRPMPRNPHLLYDPPMDEVSFWALGQIEYYLSEDNLAKDTFLREHMDAEGWVAISMLASFNRVKALSQDIDLITKALLRSTELEVSGEHARRRGDWFRWVLPTAKPTSVKRVASHLNGFAAAFGPGEHSHFQSDGTTSVPSSPTQEVKLESLPVWQGMSPHSQPTLLIGDVAPPRHHKQRSPQSKASTAPSNSPPQPESAEIVVR